MKVFALFAIFSVAMVHGQPAGGEGRLRYCNLVKYLGSGTSLDASGLADFRVVAGANVVCYTSCTSGGATTVAYNFGSEPSGSGNTDGDTDTDCRMKTKFKAYTEQTTLGWSVNTATEFKNLVLTCYW